MYIYTYYFIYTTFIYIYISTLYISTVSDTSCVHLNILIWFWHVLIYEEILRLIYICIYFFYCTYIWSMTLILLYIYNLWFWYVLIYEEILRLIYILLLIHIYFFINICIHTTLIILLLCIYIYFIYIYCFGYVMCPSQYIKMVLTCTNLWGDIEINLYLYIYILFFHCTYIYDLWFWYYSIFIIYDFDMY